MDLDLSDDGVEKDHLFGATDEVVTGKAMMLSTKTVEKAAQAKLKQHEGDRSKIFAKDDIVKKIQKRDPETMGNKMTSGRIELALKE